MNQVHTSEVLCLSVFENDPNIFLSGSSDLTAKIWDIRVKNPVQHTFKGILQIRWLIFKEIHKYGCFLLWNKVTRVLWTQWNSCHLRNLQHLQQAVMIPAFAYLILGKLILSLYFKINWISMVFIRFASAQVEGWFSVEQNRIKSRHSMC